MKDISKLSIKEKLGQLVVMGFDTVDYGEHPDYLIKEIKCGNFILFSHNFVDANRLKNLIKIIYEKEIDEIGALPFICIDQEGGFVTRLTNDVTIVPSPMSSSSSSYPNASYECGKILGNDMIKLGINFDLAPCLEVNRNLEDYLSNVRCYSSNVDKISTYVKMFKKGLLENGVLSCLKHFPGEGRAQVDSHLDLPIVDISLDMLFQEELIPFISNLDSPSIMVSHTMYKQIDEKPASISKIILTEILRNKLDYKGLIISDCMEMKAIDDYYTTAKGALEGLVNGCDMVLITHSLNKQKETMDMLYKAYQEKVLTDAMIDEKLERIYKYKKETIKHLEINFFNENKYIKNKSFIETAYNIVEKSLTVVSGKEPKINNNLRTIIITKDKYNHSLVEEDNNKSLNNKLAMALENKVTIKEYQDNDFSLLCENYDQVILVSVEYLENYLTQKEINTLNTKNNFYLISLKGPMNKKVFKGNHICLYECSDYSLKTLAKYLMGLIMAEGKIPE